MQHARTIAMANTLLADGRAEDVSDMVKPLLDPVTAPAASTGQLLLRGLMARVEVVYRNQPGRAFELLPALDEVSDLCTCVRAEVALWRGWAHARRSETIDEATRALHLLQESQELSESICDPVGRCWALLGRAHAYVVLDEYGLMRRVLDDVASLLDRLQDTQAEQWFHELQIQAHRVAGEYEQAAGHVETLRSIAEEWDDHRVRGHAAARAAALQYERGDPPRAIIEAAETATSLLRQGDPIASDPLLLATRAHAGALCRREDWPDALEAIDAAEASLPDDTAAQSVLQVLRARVALRRGEPERALALLDDIFDRTLSWTPGFQRSRIALLYGEGLLEQDCPDEAETWFRQAHRTARESGHHVDRQRALRFLSAGSEVPPFPSPSVVDPSDAVDGFVAQSRAMQGLAETIRQIQPSHSPLLVTGEGGTGKRLVARAVHATSVRAEGPLETISCAPTQHEEPLETRLFGTVEDEGSWTPGAIHAADGGTLVVEDVETLPLSLQSSLLHLLETGRATPVGGATPRTVDVRIIATTTADLDAHVQEGRFRRALRNHLGVISLHVPPLRERRADIPLLARHFLDTLRPNDSSLVSITQPAREALLRYNWPGNVRQLRNEIERALVHVQSEPAPTINVDVLPDSMVETAQRTRSPQLPKEDSDSILRPDQTLSDVLSRTEKAVIERVLQACDGQITASADVLGLTRQGLYKKMKRLDVDASAFQPSSDPAPTSS